MRTNLQILLEALVEQSVALLEKIRSASFQIREFKSLVTQEDRLNYAKEHLDHVAPPSSRNEGDPNHDDFIGSSRIVYILSSNKVIKLALTNHDHPGTL